MKVRYFKEKLENIDYYQYYSDSLLFNDKRTIKLFIKQYLYNDYFMNCLFTIESQMYNYVPYKIFDRQENKYVKNINANGGIEYEN
jgi:hypothetical protein